MHDLIVIGAGPGGYVAAIRAAQLGMSVLLVEKDQVGGTCLNRGCIPTKAYYESAFTLRRVQHSQQFGVQVQGCSFDMHAAWERKEQVVKKLVTGVEQLLKTNRVSIVRGPATFVDASTIKAGDEQYSAQNILIATGSQPAVLPIPGSDDPRLLNSDQILDIKEVPHRLVVIGGGVIGLEFACIFNAFGSQVTVLEAQATVLSQVDREIVKRLQVFLKRQGIAVHTSVQVKELADTGSGLSVCAETAKGEQLSIEADLVLQAAGRKPHTAGLNLEKLGIQVDQRGFIVVDENYQTNIPGIYAIGDVIGGPMLAHVASEEGIAAVEAMAGHKSKVAYQAIPSTIFTFPEIATVGLSEEEARQRGIVPLIGKFNFAANGKALTMDETDGIVKVIADQDKQIIGMHVIGPHASDLILEGTLAVSQKLTLPGMRTVIHAHPTLGEAIQEALLDAQGQAIHTAPLRKPLPKGE